jgi:hypothetical protein
MLHASILKLGIPNSFRIKLPISRDEFNKLNQRLQTPEEAVLAFLTANSQLAFTAVEISMKLDPQSSLDDPIARRVTVILQNLLTRKTVVGRWQQTGSGPEYFYTVP